MVKLTVKMSLLYIILTWSSKCVILTAPGATTFATTNMKLHVVVVPLSTLANTKLL